MSAKLDYIQILEPFVTSDSGISEYAFDFFPMSVVPHDV